MSDIYHKDTTAALKEFTESIEYLSPVIQSAYIEIFEQLASEVDGLLSMYADNISELQTAKELVEELESKELSNE